MIYDIGSKCAMVFGEKNGRRSRSCKSQHLAREEYIVLSFERVGSRGFVGGVTRILRGLRKRWPNAHNGRQYRLPWGQRLPQRLERVGKTIVKGSGTGKVHIQGARGEGGYRWSF